MSPARCCWPPASPGRILRHWNIHSGSELQLRLERRTYLISTLLGFALGAELLSLLLFAQTAESLSGQFVGAMCATGVLNINLSVSRPCC
ncbi:MAG: hypothetical protein R3F40_18405 [Candidatus Competibacteraceae bacterium]